MVYRYSQNSLKHLKTCDDRLVSLCVKLLKFRDHSVLCGHRNRVDQNRAFQEGFSKLIFPQSKHNSYPSKAIDICPYPYPPEGFKGWDKWPRRAELYVLAGEVRAIAYDMGILQILRWGGDWDRDGDFKDQTFDDLFHFELVD